MAIPSDNKKRHVVSYEKMSPELAAAFAEKYPKGFSDYLPDIVKLPKPDGTSFDAVTIEIPDAVYLVKVQVPTDDIADLARWLEGEEDGDEGTSDGSDADGNTLPDDNIAQYSDGSDADAE